ncbi:MAG TPA: winged helix-turn-helix domain-containing protein, partial [Acidobacteriaceae bacterium]
MSSLGSPVPDSRMRDSRVVSFSPFTFDLESGELLLRGRKLFLQEQHSRVLAALLQQPGRVLSREDLKEAIWPGVAFVDYQHAINKAVSQLRKALNDNSRMPRFIETIPKRGYRFCTEVHVAGREPSAPAAGGLALAPAAEPPNPAVPGPAAPQAGPTAQGREAAPRRARRLGTARNMRRFVAASVLLAMAAAVAGGLAWRRHSHRLAAAVLPVTIGIPPFETSGPGATQMAENFRLDLTDALAALPEARLRAAHAFTGAPRDEQSVRGMALQQRLDVLIVGSFAVENGLCRLTLELVRTTDSSHIASFHYTGTPRQLRAIRDTIQRDVFTRLKLNGAPHAAPSSSAQAYAAYLRGREHLTERTDDALRQATTDFKAAMTLDPKFADAWAGLASVTMLLADRDPPAGTYPEAKALALHAVELDPSQAQAHAVLGCVAMSHDWNRAEAEKQLRLAVQLDPDEAVYHVWLAALLGLEGRFDEAFLQVDQA